MKFVDELITLRDVKEGNKELALFIDSDLTVNLYLGNDCPNDTLGAVEGELMTKGRTIEAAIDAMWILLRKKQSPS